MVKTKPSKDGKPQKAAGLVSSRYDAMYIPNHSWDFFDAFGRSALSQMAFADNAISSDGRNVDLYLKIHRKHVIEQTRALVPVIPPLPGYLQQLLAMQDRSGQFRSLDKVMHALSLKALEWSKIRQYEMYQEWQLATAIVLAVYRQHSQYFDRLADSYESARALMPLDGLIYEVRLLMEESLAKEDDRASTNGQRHAYNEQLNELARSAAQPRMVEGEEEVADLIAQYTGQPADPDNAEDDSEETEPDDEPLVSEQLEDTSTKQLHEYFDQAFEDMTEAAESPQMTSPSSPKGLDFSALRAAVDTLTVKVDQEQIALLEQQVNTLGVRLVSLALEIEELTKSILRCLQRSVLAYNQAELFVLRYHIFDELTAMLGEGFVGTSAYDDWRRIGVKGMRPVVIAFFDCLYQLAATRLDLLEQYMPIGIKQRVFTEDMKAARWVLLFQGQDLALRVLHSLDFLRKCRELSDWYGPSYYFMANPLSLPFATHKALEGLVLEAKVADLFGSIPHARAGIAIPGMETDWQHSNYLENFRRSFQFICKDWSFNWPSIPNVIAADANQRLFRALVTMFVCCSESILSTYHWETKFQGKISTVRGQSEFLIGENNQRTDKQLKIPTIEVRKPRYTLIKRMANKRQSMVKVVKDERKDSVFSVVRVADLKQPIVHTPAVEGAVPQSRFEGNLLPSMGMVGAQGEGEGEGEDAMGMDIGLEPSMSLEGTGSMDDEGGNNMQSFSFDDEDTNTQSNTVEDTLASLEEIPRKTEMSKRRVSSPKTPTRPVSGARKKSTARPTRSTRTGSLRPNSASPTRKDSVMKPSVMLKKKKKKAVEKESSVSDTLQEDSIEEQSHVSMSTAGTEDKPEPVTVALPSEGSPKTAAAAAGVQAGEASSEPAESGEPAEPAIAPALYQKKSIYRDNQRVSFTGMQSLIRRESNATATSNHQLSRIDSIRQKYKSSRNLQVVEEEEEKTRRRANIVKRPVSEAGPSAPSGPASPTGPPSPVAVRALAKRSSVVSVDKGPARKIDVLPTLTEVAGPKVRKTVRIQLDPPATAPAALPVPVPVPAAPVRASSAKRVSILAPSKMQSIASSNDDSSEASTIDQEVPAERRPSMVRQRIAAAMAANQGQGQRDKVARVALPVLKENAGGLRSIQGIPSDTNRMTRMTKRRPSSGPTKQ